MHPLLKPLQDFASSVTRKMNQITRGESEDQLRGPFEQFIIEAGSQMGLEIVPTGETRLDGRLGRPDYAIHISGLLSGYVELKAPNEGVGSFKGRNLQQFKRFSAIPNLLYSTGNEWALYRNGVLQRRRVRINGDVATDGDRAVTAKDAEALQNLLRDYFTWHPSIPTDRRGKIDLKAFAELLAPLCAMLRDDVSEALTEINSPLVQLAGDWRQLLFPDASDEQFADAYAQTVTFALLLGRSEGADPLTLDNAEKKLAAQHSLLSRALQVLTDEQICSEISASLNLLLRVIAVVPPATFVGPQDPWLYFYEDFLAAYDPKLRKDAGAYYTPVEVVRAQVHLVDDLLVNRFGKRLGFADSDVITLDPAAGTGTYLLGVIEHALKRIESEQGTGAIAGQATTLAKNLYGFELMVGPYAVTELRVSRALRDRGARLPSDGTHIYLTDTLESPHADPPVLPFYLKPISEQHEKALKVKSNVPVIVCLGNPPYDRHDAVDTDSDENLSRYGGWVRFGDPLPNAIVRGKSGKERRLRTTRAVLAEREKRSVLRAFIDPAVNAGHGTHVKNLYNLYVYFWRWALWKVFEHKTSQGPGIVSFITASSYLDGAAFCGLREHMRRVCDEIWIIDLGGEGRGTRKDDNVFAIQTPVAIAVAARTRKKQKDTPAIVHYARLEGSRDEKLNALNTIDTFSDVTWLECPSQWQSSFRPAGNGAYFDLPLLTDLMPWQHSGVQLKRTWPICFHAGTLQERWRVLLQSPDRSKYFKETRDRKIESVYNSLQTGQPLSPIKELSTDAPAPQVVRYAYRSFDRQYVLFDSRLGDFLRPVLWQQHSEKQLYLASISTQSISIGPSLAVSSHIPDLHYFRGSFGAKDNIPLFRNAEGTDPNIAPGLLDLLGTTYRVNVSAEDFLAYIYGILAHPAFTDLFHKELESRELRVPITKDKSLYTKVRDIGAKLLWLHTYGERYVPDGGQRGHVPPGSTKCLKAVPEHIDGYPESFSYNKDTRTLHVGDGEFAPVSPELFNFEVSGLNVVKSWLKYRMKNSSGKKSSPLDDIRPESWTSSFTTELLELLWVLEASLAQYPEQAKLLMQVVGGEMFNIAELPPVPEEMRKAPQGAATGEDFFR